ncbi:hypothetical protein [Bradyrhizobium canariense]
MLQNNLRVVVMVDHSTPVTEMISYKVASADDELGKSDWRICSNT